MTNTIPIDEWLRFVEGDYLTTFIKDGGAAVKFAITHADRRSDLIQALKSRCGARGYMFVELDAAKIRIHMPQDIFFGLSSQIDWRFLARRVILRLLSEKGYRVDSIEPKTVFNVIDAIAQMNGNDKQYVLTELRPALESEVFKDSNMAKVFRVAMTQLCRCEEPERYAGQPLLEWLTGDNPKIGNVRPFHIHTGINRTTARYFIESTSYWIRRAGYTGTVIALDNARVTLTRNPRDGSRYYTRAAVMDHYELLREFIDDVDRLSGTLLTVVADYDFIDDQSARGWRIYSALHTRVMDDVRDENVVNPAAALVRLS